MCLENRSEKLLAKEDIICYKQVNVVINPKNIVRGSKFTGKIKNIQCSGKISKNLEDEIFFCTNDIRLNGVYCKEKFGYEYSWQLDNKIQSIIVDGKELCTKFKTPYMNFPIKIGETYFSELEEVDSFRISIGLHSYKSLEDVSIFKRIIVKCLIPKGSYYYTGYFGDIPSYASDTLTYLELIQQ